MRSRLPSTVSEIESASNGNTMMGKAREFGNPEAFFSNLARIATAKQLGEYQALHEKAQSMGMPIQEMVMSEGMARSSFAVAGHDVDELVERGVINDDQAAVLQRNGGGLLTASFTPGEGLAVATSVSTGASSNVDNTHSEKHGVDLGGLTSTESIARAQNTEELSEVLEVVDQTEAGRNEFVRTMAINLDNIAHSTVSETQDFSGNLGAGVTGTFGTGSAGTRRGPGAMASGDAHASISGGTSDTDAYNANYGIVNDAYKQARKEATRQTSNEISNNSLSQEFQNEYFYNRFAENLSQRLDHIFEETKEQNVEFVSGIGLTNPGSERYDNLKSNK